MPVVGGFSDLVELGRGGFSRVFSAYQVEFDRRVALKVLNDRLADDASVAVFEGECRAMGTLSQHPFIVTVLASALTADYRPCIVMELFERGNYMQLLRRDGPLPLEELLSLAVRVAGALATAHHHGVVHGDVKPQNVLKSEFGYPALGDFGIATLRNRLSERAGMGLSAHYAAPEMIESGAAAAAAAADQYSLAVTIFTLACGRRPFEGATAGEAPERVLARVLAAPTPLLAASFPADLAGTLARAMSRDPHHRFPDLAAFAFALTAVEHQLGYRATAVPLASIDDDATITINHPNPPQPPPPSQPTQRPPGDEHTIALTPQPPATPPEPPQKPNRRRRITALLVLLLATTGAAAYLTLGSDTPQPDAPTPAASTQPDTTAAAPEPDNQPAPTDTTTQASATDSNPPAPSAPAAAATDIGSQTTITLAVNQWTGSAVNAAVAAQLLESELGYTVETALIDELAQWEAINSGHIDASLEVWPDPGRRVREDFIDSPNGNVDDAGLLGPIGKIGWFMPTYMVDQYPALVTWEGLADPELVALFATAETGDKGQYLSGHPSWTNHDQQIIENLGLNFDIVHAGSEMEILTALDAAYNRQDPILFYFWTPHSAFDTYNLTKVKLPEYNDECHARAGTGGVDCDYPAYDIFKIVNRDLKNDAPLADAFLRNMNYAAADQISMLAAVELDGLSIEEAAAAWIEANSSTWSTWLP